jgi:hypothetical protein
VPKLLELYPEAKVIVTTRNPDAWWRSISAVSEKALMSFLPIFLPPPPHYELLPGLSHCSAKGSLGATLFYYEPGQMENSPEVWDRHMEHVKQVVPVERLFFFDVHGWWGPLCKIQGVDVPPDGIEFPKLNDGDAIDDFAKRVLVRAALVWTGIGAVVSLVIAAGWSAWQR